MGFEENLAAGIFNQNSEKSFVDKLLAKDDVNAIRTIIKKPSLTRADILEVLYLLSSTEAKLLNYSEWDRYVILKFFVWIREFVKVAEILFDYRDNIEIKENTCKKCANKKDKCSCTEFEPAFKASENYKKLISNNMRLIEHNTKFLIDLYLNIGRTSLSIGATGLLELLKNKFEFTYPSGAGMPMPSNMGNNIAPFVRY